MRRKLEIWVEVMMFGLDLVLDGVVKFVLIGYFYKLLMCFIRDIIIVFLVLNWVVMI